MLKDDLKAFENLLFCRQKSVRLVQEYSLELSPDKLWQYLAEGHFLSRTLSYSLQKSGFHLTSKFYSCDALPIQWQKGEWIHYEFLGRTPALKYLGILLKPVSGGFSLELKTVPDLRPMFQLLLADLPSHLEFEQDNTNHPDLPQEWLDCTKDPEMAELLWQSLNTWGWLRPVSLAKGSHFSFSKLFESCLFVSANGLLEPYVLKHNAKTLPLLLKADQGPQLLDKSTLDRDTELIWGSRNMVYPWALLPVLDSQRRLAPRKALKLKHILSDPLLIRLPELKKTFYLKKHRKGAKDLRLKILPDSEFKSIYPLCLPTEVVYLNPDKRFQMIQSSNNSGQEEGHLGHLYASQWVADAYPQILPQGLTQFDLSQVFFLGADIQGSLTEDELKNYQGYFQTLCQSHFGYLAHSQQQAVLLHFASGEQSIQAALNALEHFQEWQKFGLTQEPVALQLVLHFGACRVYLKDSARQYLGSGVRDTLAMLSHSSGHDLILSPAVLEHTSLQGHLVSEHYTMIQFHPETDGGYQETAFYQLTLSN